MRDRTTPAAWDGRRDGVLSHTPFYGLHLAHQIHVATLLGLNATSRTCSERVAAGIARSSPSQHPDRNTVVDRQHIAPQHQRDQEIGPWQFGRAWLLAHSSSGITRHAGGCPTFGSCARIGDGASAAAPRPTRSSYAERRALARRAVRASLRRRQLKLSGVPAARTESAPPTPVVDVGCRCGAGRCLMAESLTAARPGLVGHRKLATAEPRRRASRTALRTSRLREKDTEAGTSFS